MIYNEIIFVLQTIIVSFCVLVLFLIGPEALIAGICLQAVLSNLLVAQQISLCGLTATASDAFIIGSVLSLNLLQEYYGKNITRKALGITLLILSMYAACAQLHLLYTPLSCDSMHQHFKAILSHMPHLVFTGMGIFALVQLFDYWLYGILKYSCNNRYLVLRNYISLGISQLLDTILFTFIGLGYLTTHHWQIITISYTIKIVAIVLSTPCILVAKKFKSPASRE